MWVFTLKVPHDKKLNAHLLGYVILYFNGVMYTRDISSNTRNKDVSEPVFNL